MGKVLISPFPKGMLLLHLEPRETGKSNLLEVVVLLINQLTFVLSKAKNLIPLWLMAISILDFSVISTPKAYPGI